MYYRIKRSGFAYLRRLINGKQLTGVHTRSCTVGGLNIGNINRVLRDLVRNSPPPPDSTAILMIGTNDLLNSRKMAEAGGVVSTYLPSNFTVVSY